VDLTEKQKKFLRALAHTRRPAVLVGQSGFSEAVASELARALTDHELVKVRVRVGDRENRDSVIAMLTRATGGVLVQRIGNVAVLYRARPDDPRIILPDG